MPQRGLAWQLGSQTVLIKRVSVTVEKFFGDRPRLRLFDPSTRAPAMAGDHSLGIPPENRGVVLSERSESKGDGGGAPGLPGGAPPAHRHHGVVRSTCGAAAASAPIPQ